MDTLRVGLMVGSKELLAEVQACLHNLDSLPVRVVFDEREITDQSAFLAKVEQSQAEVLLLDLSEISVSLEEFFRQLKATSASPMLVVLNSSAQPDTILKAMRAGADEFLYPPLAQDLNRALQRMSSERTRRQAGTRPRGKLFGVLSAKGGCGATTLACHLAVEFHRQTGLQVLLADFDLDSGIVGFLMKSQSRYTILDAVDNVHRLDSSFWKALVSNGHPGVEVIMAPGGLPAIRERNQTDFQNVLKFVRGSYDWTIVDFGRGLSRFVLPLLDETDATFLVTTADIPALHQAKQITQTLADAGFGRQRINLILNRMPKKTDVGIAELEKMLGTSIYAGIPDASPELYEAFADGRLVSGNEDLGRHFARIAGKITGVKKKEKKRFLFV